MKISCFTNMVPSFLLDIFTLLHTIVDLIHIVFTQALLLYVYHSDTRDEIFLSLNNILASATIMSTSPTPATETDFFALRTRLSLFFRKFYPLTFFITLYMYMYNIRLIVTSGNTHDVSLSKVCDWRCWSFWFMWTICVAASIVQSVQHGYILSRYQHWTSSPSGNTRTTHCYCSVVEFNIDTKDNEISRPRQRNQIIYNATRDFTISFLAQLSVRQRCLYNH